MSKQRKTTSDEPTETADAKTAIEKALREAVDQLAAVAESPWSDGFADALRDVREYLGQIDSHIALQSLRERRSKARTHTIGEAVASNIKKLREWSGWTQAEVANAMTRLGFVTWKRITVAESESGKRKLSMEELMGYGILFGVPAARIAVPFDILNDVALNERLVITNAQATELLVGEVGYPTDLITETGVGAEIIGAGSEDGGEDWRPVAKMAEPGRSNQ